MKQFFCLFLLVFTLISTLRPAMAVTNQKEADQLKQIVTSILSQKTAEFRIQGQELKAEGDVIVEPGDHYYAVTTPHLSLVEPDGSSTDIGILAINALPGKAPKEWSVTIAVPTPVIRYDAQKKIQAKVSIGAQTLAGLWNEDASSFVKLDARYENIEIQQVEDAITVKIPKTSILYDLSPGADGKTWSGPARYSMEKLEISKNGDPAVSKIGQITADVFVHDYSPAAMKDYQNKIQAIANPASGELVAREGLQGIYNLIFDSAGTLWDGFDTGFTVRDIDLVRSGTARTPAERIMLKQAGFTFNVSGFNKNDVSITVKTNYDGLNIAPSPAGFNESIPSRMGIGLTISKIPFKELVDLGRTTLQAGTSSPEQVKLAGMQAVSLIPQILTAAGTTFTVNPSSFANATYDVQMSGNIVANLKAMMGAQGKGRIEVNGLGSMIDLMNEKLKDKSLDEPSRKTIRDTLVTLTVLQTVGQKKENEKKVDIRTYDIELTEAGKLTLNGTDLSVLQTLIGTAKGTEKKAAP